MLNETVWRMRTNNVKRVYYYNGIPAMVKQQYLKICINTCADPGIFIRGGGSGEGGPGPSAIKKSLTRFFLYFVCFLVFNLFYRSPMVYFKKNVQGSRGVQHLSRGWDVPTFFPKGGPILQWESAVSFLP